MKNFGSSVTNFSLKHYRLITLVMVVVTLAAGLAAGLPSLRLLDNAPAWVQRLSQKLSFLPVIQVDTDPENMLDADEPVRVFHNQMKKRMDLNDIVVVGVVNEANANGVFNPDTLEKIYRLTEFAKGLQFDERGNLITKQAPAENKSDASEPMVEGLDDWVGSEEPVVPGLDGAETETLPAPPAIKEAPLRGVIPGDIIAPSTVDSVEPRNGAIVFEWLMQTPPKTEAEALEIRRKAMRVPFLEGTLVSDDGKAIAIYLPITQKDLSYKVYRALQGEIAKMGPGPEQWHITGLPVAEDTFGVEMFIQMAISAPAAMVVIFLLMLLFFRKLIVVVAPMIVAMVSVILTMGALIISGFPIHIMSSMIPIFIMPIAVLDSIHIISEFFEKYQATRDRAKTMRAVMDELFSAMLYTSLTSAAGFASLAMTPIPPVQVFGVFVAIGVMIAWMLTVTFIPAFVMFIPPRRLENFGSKHHAAEGETEGHGWVGRSLYWMGGATARQAKPIIAISLVVLAIAGYGISKIQINDNPVKWFVETHPIREADRVLNAHFGGTYMAYLAMTFEKPAWSPQQYVEEFATQADEEAEALSETFPAAAQAMSALVGEARNQASKGADEKTFFAALTKQADAIDDSALRSKVDSFVEMQQRRDEVFKRPAVLEWQLQLQQALLKTGVVGKSNSLADIVRTVYRDLMATDVNDPDLEKYDRVPDQLGMVAECLIQFQSSHRYGDIDHFVTPDYQTASLWVQLTSGDNRDMEKVVKDVNAFLDKNPPPAALKTEWIGLTYINVIWQDKMVTGMLRSFSGSFLVVFLLMTILFRSPLWGLLSMIPLTLTIVANYGAIGLIGKDYDMPVAVLSSLTLGLAVDFAIHFLMRAREFYRRYGSWSQTSPYVFGEPARAITRNIIVIAAGFLPLLLAPLVPYQTVGILLATILLVSGMATLLLLPALIRVMENPLFRSMRSTTGFRCSRSLCVVASAALVGVILLNLESDFGWDKLVWISLISIPILAGTCALLSRRSACRAKEEKKDD